MQDAATATATETQAETRGEERDQFIVITGNAINKASLRAIDMWANDEREGAAAGIGLFAWLLARARRAAPKTLAIGQKYQVRSEGLSLLFGQSRGGLLSLINVRRDEDDAEQGGGS